MFSFHQEVNRIALKGLCFDGCCGGGSGHRTFCTCSNRQLSRLVGPIHHGKGGSKGVTLANLIRKCRADLGIFVYLEASGSQTHLVLFCNRHNENFPASEVVWSFERDGRLALLIRSNRGVPVAHILFD